LGYSHATVIHVNRSRKAARQRRTREGLRRRDVRHAASSNKATLEPLLVAARARFRWRGTHRTLGGLMRMTGARDRLARSIKRCKLLTNDGSHAPSTCRTQALTCARGNAAGLPKWRLVWCMLALLDSPLACPGASWSPVVGDTEQAPLPWQGVDKQGGAMLLAEAGRCGCKVAGISSPVNARARVRCMTPLPLTNRWRS